MSYTSTKFSTHACCTLCDSGERDRAKHEVMKQLTDLRENLRESIVSAREDVAHRANNKRCDIDKGLLVDGAKCWLSLEGINLP